MIEVTFITSVSIWLLSFLIGVHKEYWTPRRLLWHPVFSFLPFDIAAVFQVILDEKYLMVIPVVILLLIITFAYGYILSNHIQREPWRSKYHIKVDSEEEGNS